MRGIKFQGLLLAFVVLMSIFFTSPSHRFLSSKGKTTPQFLAEPAKSQELKSENFSATAAILETTSAGDNTAVIHSKKADVSAEIFLKRLLNSGVNLAEQKIENRWPIASLTKLMTALLVAEKVDLNSTVLLSENATNQEGTIGNFQPGEKYKAYDLLKAMLFLSSNDAAEALAEVYNEKVLTKDQINAGQDFVFMMNQKASELGMSNTKYVDPTGLSFLNQSTANDLAKLVNYIYLNHPEILKITAQKTISFIELNSGKIKTFNNLNEFAGEPNFLGGKTGYINESKGNLVSLFQDPNGRGPILIIVLGSEDRFRDTRQLLNN